MAQGGEKLTRPGVVLLNFGGPTSAGEVEKFLFNLFSDENIIPVRPGFFRILLARFIAYLRKRKTLRKLEVIGGKSPLVEISSETAAMLERNLRQTIPDIRVYAAMRYSPPFIEEILAEAKRDGIDRFIVLPLYPQFCKVTTGSSFNSFWRAHKKICPAVPALFVNSYHNHPLYISAVAKKVREVLSEASGAEGRIEVIFAAHSIPLEIVSSGDPYLAQVRETADRIAQALGIPEYSLAFQSAARKSGWLSPVLDEAMEKAAARGFKKILIVPISFTCDNLETLYDIDVIARRKAQRLGIALYRAECLNSSTEFIDALSQMVISTLRGEKS